MSRWWEEAVSTLTFCWRLERGDGITLGFTSHDRDLMIEGLVYRAAPGLKPSAITRSDGLETSTLDMSGALSGEGIREQDLAAGRWDGAAVRLSAVDWTQPEVDPLLLARGTIGDVEIRDGAFTAELAGPASVLDRPAGERTSPGCRASLGDRRCRVDMAPRIRSATIAAVESETVLVLDTVEPGANAYAYGSLRWIDGPNSGLASAICRSEAGRLELAEPPFAPATPGVRIELAEGCDKRFQTCRSRFANVANFRGEPHLPGNDLLIRYPGS